MSRKLSDRIKMLAHVHTTNEKILLHVVVNDDLRICGPEAPLSATLKWEGGGYGIGYGGSCSQIVCRSYARSTKWFLILMTRSTPSFAV